MKKRFDLFSRAICLYRSIWKTYSLVGNISLLCQSLQLKLAPNVLAVVIALCPAANCYDWFPAAPNAVV